MATMSVETTGSLLWGLAMRLLNVIFLNKLTAYDESAQQYVKLITKATLLKRFLVN